MFEDGSVLLTGFWSDHKNEQTYEQFWIEFNHGIADKIMMRAMKSDQKLTQQQTEDLAS